MRVYVQIDAKNSIPIIYLKIWKCAIPESGDATSVQYYGWASSYIIIQNKECECPRWLYKNQPNIGLLI